MVDKQLQDYMYQKELIAGIEERAQVILQAVELTRDACLAKQGDGDAVVTGSNFGGVSTAVMQKMKKLGLGSGGGVVVRKAKEMSSAKVVELAHARPPRLRGRGRRRRRHRHRGPGRDPLERRHGVVQQPIPRRRVRRTYSSQVFT